MQKMFFALMMAAMLSSCATAVPVKIDVDTSKSLPKEIAVRYLQKVTSENIFRSVNDMCVFTYAGFYLDPSEYYYPDNLIKYEDSFMSLHMFADHSYKLLISRNKEFIGGSCLVAYKKDVHEENTELFFNKIPTALKSLGVKVKTK